MNIKEFLVDKVEPTAVHIGILAMAAATVFGVTEMSRQPVRDIAVTPMETAFRVPHEHEVGRLSHDYGIVKHTTISGS